MLALVAAVLLAGSWFEIALPDVHDGDAVAVAHVDCVSQTTGVPGCGTLPMTPDHSPRPSGGSSHDVHVDHCSHGHVATALIARRLSTRTSFAGNPDSCAATARPNREPDLHFRPPIA